MIFALARQLSKVSATPDFRELFESELTYVWHTLRRLGVPARDRVDVGHDVFLAVHRHLAEYDRSRPLRPWLFGFAFRCASDYRKKARHRYEVMGHHDDSIEDKARGHDDVLADQDLLERALMRLDEDKRAVVILHDLEERTMKEIAETLGIPMPTGYSRLHAARDALVAALAELRGGAQ